MFDIKFSIALKQTCSSLDIFAFAIDQTRSFLQVSWIDFCVLQMDDMVGGLTHEPVDNSSDNCSFLGLRF